MKRELTIDGCNIRDDGPAYVIAEIGHNHQGNLDKAKQLFKAAKDSGANAVKLQKRHNKSLYTRKLYEQPYENENSYGPTYGAHREALEFGKAEYVELKAYARELGITFFSTAFDFASADFLAELDMPAYKFASGDLTNTPLQKHVARIGKPMLLSTGGGASDDVRRACDTILPLNPQLSVLHCTASYPADVHDLNLRVITTLREEYPNLIIGLSDHENGIDCAIVAYMLGARVFEKHFTLNHSWKGTDNAFSLEPTGMRKMVRDLQRIPISMGSGVKQRLACEEKPLSKMSKKLVAARELPAGHTLRREDIALKSPGDGLPPYHLDALIGRRLKKALVEDDNLIFEVVE